jgi:Lrp/AsnC family leucine-responsive transcriptional regulator
MPSQTKIDKIDLKIIRTLQKDARANFVDIAKDCGVSTDTISKRFRRLRKNGVARGTTALLNPKSLGHDCVASFGMKVDYLHVEEVTDLIAELPGVVFCTSSMGEHNIFAIAVVENVGKIGRMKENIKRHSMVREVTASIWVDDTLLCPENFEFRQLEQK